MKLAYLTEVAALMAAHHRLFIEQPRELPNQIIGDFYIISRNRFNRWMRDLNDLENGLSVRDPMHLTGIVSSRPATRSLTEQIMINEMVARIWTILLIARDQLHGEDRVRPLAHNVFLGHVSIRHKALSVCLTDDRMTPRDMLAVDKLRTSTERWTDMLCCELMNEFNLWQYAFDRERATEFLRDRTEAHAFPQNSQAWVLILAGIRHSFPDRDGLGSLIHEDDRSLTRLMLNSFPQTTPEMRFWLDGRAKQAGTAN